MKFIEVNFTISIHFTILSSFVDLQSNEYDPNQQIYIFPKDREEGKRRILGGSSVPSFSYSFVVALLDLQKIEHCTGSIIAPTFVLTAAHCSFGPGSHFVYKALKNNKRKGGKYYQVMAFISHPSYSHNSVEKGNMTSLEAIQNDIALVQTSENMIQGWVTHIPLSHSAVVDVLHQLATIIGFGFTNVLTIPGLSNLQHTQVELVECPPKYTITVCGVTPKNADETRSACGGDSGGPLVHDGKLLGVISFAAASCSPSLPRETSLSGCTLVSAYIPWINRQLLTKQAKPHSNLISKITTTRTSNIGARVSKSIKYSESGNSNNVNYEKKTIIKDTYYINRSNNNSLLYSMTTFIILTNLHFILCV